MYRSVGKWWETTAGKTAASFQRHNGRKTAGKTAYSFQIDLILYKSQYKDIQQNTKRGQL